MSSESTAAAAQNAVKETAAATEPEKPPREPLLLTLSERMAAEYLRKRRAELEQEETLLLTEIIQRNGLDPAQIGKEFLVTPTAIVFEVS